MKRLSAIPLLLTALAGPGAPAGTAQAFRLTLLTDPSSMDPQTLSSASGNYITTLLYRGLYRWTAEEELIEDEGRCAWKGALILECEIFENAKWSDGSPVVAKDYLRGFDFLMNPKNGAPQAQLLENVGGLREVSARSFRIDFKKPDGEFLFKLVHPALTPRHKNAKRKFQAQDKPVSNGAFYLSSFKPGQSYSMKRNPHYPLPAQVKRPVGEIEALVIDSDNTTLELYDSGRIQFARRVPAEHFSAYSKRKDFHRFPVLRFDYIGFGPTLQPERELRMALAHSIDGRSFQKIFESPGRPGCPSISRKFYEGKICHPFSVPKEKPPWPRRVPADFGFSMMGGDDIRRGAEWYQGQWKKNLGIRVNLEPREQKMYLQQLKTKPPALFRKGLSLDRPTCLAALENFQAANPENFIRLNDARYEKILNEMGQTTDLKKKKSLCSEGLRLLIEEAKLIPLGEMYFSILVKPEFTGWEINSLNQLSLTNLAGKPDPGPASN